MRILYATVLGCLISGISGCQSSSTNAVSALPGPPSQPPPPAQPAPDNKLLAFESLATHSNSTTLASALAGASEKVTISEGTPGDGDITVNIGTATYLLKGSVSQGNPVFSDNSSGMQVSVGLSDEESNAVLALIQSGNGVNQDQSGYTTLGEATNASDFGDLIKSGLIATYSGSSHLIATRSDGARDSADGTLNLNVDFEKGEIDGDLKLVSSSASTGGNQFEIDAVDLFLSNGKIIDGKIKADIDALMPSTPFVDGSNQLHMDPNARVSSGDLIGEVYGKNAENIGGTFEFQGTNVFTIPSQKLDIVVKGGFLGKR